MVTYHHSVPEIRYYTKALVGQEKPRGNIKHDGPRQC